MIQEIFISNAFTKEGQPDGTDVAIIDPYTGCQLQCPYCFQLNDVEWSKQIFINTNIAELIKNQISDIDEDIYIGSKCDPYMQLEEKYHLTRQCLNVLSSCKNRVFINTKADNKLVLQDVQLLKSFNTPPTVLMGLSNIKQAGNGKKIGQINSYLF
ncbi:MAG: hypothetical protein R3Y47_03755 [Lachnospiraceae bacterium]